MKTNTKFFGTLFVLSLFMFTGCKKEGKQGETGPAGATGPAGPVVSIANAGSISGTINGKRKDGVIFSEPFSYTYYFPSMGNTGTLDSLGTNSYLFSVQRSTSDIFSQDYASVMVNTTSKTATSGTMNLSLTFEKTLNGKRFFYFNGSVNSASTTISYNTSTGALTGNFTTVISGFQNSTTNSATVTATYQADIMERVYRLQNPNAGTKVH